MLSSISFIHSLISPFISLVYQCLPAPLELNQNCLIASTSILIFSMHLFFATCWRSGIVIGTILSLPSIENIIGFRAMLTQWESDLLCNILFFNSLCKLILNLVIVFTIVFSKSIKILSYFYKMGKMLMEEDA